MTSSDYHWTRYWCAREGHFSVDAQGYLLVPDAGVDATGAVLFEAVNELPCLILLGEPGIGKSRSLQSAFAGEKANAALSGDAALSYNLRSFGTEDRLVRTIFESAEVREWIQSDRTLSLFLDSFDEALLRIEVLAALLADEIKQLPVERLRLRLACRTADWPGTLEGDLRSIFGEGRLGVFELLPLSKQDVEFAAAASGLDPTQFIHELDQRSAVPLAIKPITLHFLLTTFVREQKLPLTRAALYEKGIRLLCEEGNPYRRESQGKGMLNADQRMEVAARIAAVTILGNRYAIWTGSEAGSVPDEDVLVRELYGGAEPVGVDLLEVTEGAVLEALGTGVFSSRGLQRMGWAHQTYGE